MNSRNYILAGLAIILVIIVGMLIGKKLRGRSLPNGKVTTPNSSTSQPDSIQQPIPGRPQVTILTSKGEFTIELRPDLAPQTVANFLTKWANGYCNDKIFHRVEDWVIQGCDPRGDGTGGQDILPTELSSENFTAGSVGVARKASSKNISNDSQFFIVKKDSPFLNSEYTYFGKVISGMEVVNSLVPGDTIISTITLSK